MKSILALATFALAASSQAGLTLYFYAGNLATGGTTPASTTGGVVGKLSIVDIAGGVQMKLENLSPMTSTQKFSDLSLNIKAFAGTYTFTQLTSTFNSNGQKFSSNGVNGPGSNDFDAEISFATSNPGFSPGKYSEWKITGTGLTSAKFDELSVKKKGKKLEDGDYLAMLHVQSLRDGSSVKVFGSTQEPVPEPATLAALGLGAAALLRRRRAR